MDFNFDNFEYVTIELREHADGKWDLCFLAPGEKTHKISRMTFNAAITQLHRVVELREKLLKERPTDGREYKNFR
jgi:hypothetical protein